MQIVRAQCSLNARSMLGRTSGETSAEEPALPMICSRIPGHISCRQLPVAAARPTVLPPFCQPCQMLPAERFHISCNHHPQRLPERAPFVHVPISPWETFLWLFPLRYYSVLRTPCYLLFSRLCLFMLVDASSAPYGVHRTSILLIRRPFRAAYFCRGETRDDTGSRRRKSFFFHLMLTDVKLSPAYGSTVQRHSTLTGHRHCHDPLSTSDWWATWHSSIVRRSNLLFAIKSSRPFSVAFCGGEQASEASQ